MLYIGTYQTKTRRYIYFYKDAYLYMIDKQEYVTSIIYYTKMACDISRNEISRDVNLLNEIDFPICVENDIDYNIIITSDIDIFNRIEEVIFEKL